MQILKDMVSRCDVQWPCRDQCAQDFATACPNSAPPVHIFFNVASNRVSVPVVDRDGLLNNMECRAPTRSPNQNTGECAVSQPGFFAR